MLCSQLRFVIHDRLLCGSSLLLLLPCMQAAFCMCKQSFGYGSKLLSIFNFDIDIGLEPKRQFGQFSISKVLICKFSNQLKSLIFLQNFCIQLQCQREASLIRNFALKYLLQKLKSTMNIRILNNVTIKVLTFEFYWLILIPNRKINLQKIFLELFLLL